MWYSLLLSSCIVSAMAMDIARMRGRAKRDQEGAPNQSTQLSAVYVRPEECFDRTSNCEEESRQGFCETNSNYMEERCPWSCRLCKKIGGDTKQCNDQHKHCKRWQKRGDCLNRMDFMGQNCKRSCELCGSESKYFDEDVRCPQEAKTGKCKYNAQMALRCPHSCHKFRFLVYIPTEPQPQVSDSTVIKGGSQQAHQNGPEPTEEPMVHSTYQDKMGPTGSSTTSDYDDEEVQKVLEATQKDDRQHKLEVVLQKSKENSSIAHPIYRNSHEPLVPNVRNGTKPVNITSLVPIRMDTDPKKAIANLASAEGSGDELDESEETKEEKEDGEEDADEKRTGGKRVQANEDKEETPNRKKSKSKKADKTKSQKVEDESLIYKLWQEKK